MSSSSLKPDKRNVDFNQFLPFENSVWSQESTIRQQALDRCLLPLTAANHKGSSGRIGVLGGSKKYTGAPFYASMASLKVGADLAYCFCAEEASIPIKSYSPELMVVPVYRASEFDKLVKERKSKSDEAEVLIQSMVEEVDETLQKLHALVIGPGLGRCPMVIEATSRIIAKALSANIPLVIDADGIFILTLLDYKSILHAGKEKSEKSIVILTPNVMEWKKLEGLVDSWDQDRVLVVQKGFEDIIRFRNGDSLTFLNCSELGGLKRSGGLGDVLAGTLGTFIAWNKILVEKGRATPSDAPLACWFACSLVKRSTHIAFHEHHRAMTAPDVLHALGPTFHEMTNV